ncbi:MAG: hypothetical protein KF858_04220 [Candidatus Sumerlaeia bacterium]|nr:hypothetical protein [Candidatus Sumerlaeia bacterium]
MSAISPAPPPGGKESRRRLLVGLFLLMAVALAAQPGWDDQWFGDPLVTEPVRVADGATTRTASLQDREVSVAPPRVGLARLGEVAWNWDTMVAELTDRRSRALPDAFRFVERPGQTVDDFLAGLTPADPEVWLLCAPAGVTRGGMQTVESREVVVYARRGAGASWRLESQDNILDEYHMGEGAAEQLRASWDARGPLLVMACDPDSAPRRLEGLLDGLSAMLPPGESDKVQAIVFDTPPRPAELVDVLATMPVAPSVVVIVGDESGPEVAEVLARRRPLPGDPLVVAVGESPRFRAAMLADRLDAWILPNYGVLLDITREPRPAERPPRDQVWVIPSERWLDASRRGTWRLPPP